MTTRQGELSLLDEPVAQELLKSTLPAHLAYTWTDGSPRVVPIWFHWNGVELVLSGPTDAPKFHVLHDGAQVAISIDTTAMPYKVLMIRGTIRMDTVDGIPLEYEQSALRVLGAEAGKGFIENMRPLIAHTTRIFVTPEWVGLLDFETRFPSAIERTFAQMQAM